MKLTLPPKAAREAAKLLGHIDKPGLRLAARVRRSGLEVSIQAASFAVFRARLTSALRDIKVVLDAFKLTQTK